MAHQLPRQGKPTLVLHISEDEADVMIFKLPIEEVARIAVHVNRDLMTSYETAATHRLGNWALGILKAVGE